MEIKKIFYIFCSTILGLLLAVVVHGLLEQWYINRLLDQGVSPIVNNVIALDLYLPPMVEMGIFLGGIAGGFRAGIVWWRIVYVEKRRRTWR